MKRVRRILRWGLIFLAALLFLFVVEENVRGWLSLRRWEKDRRAKGEKIRLNEFSSRKVSTATNGAPALLAAIDALGTNVTVQALGGSLLQFVAPGKAAAIWETGIIRGGADLGNLHLDRLKLGLSNSWWRIERLRAATRAAAFDFGPEYAKRDLPRPASGLPA